MGFFGGGGGGGGGGVTFGTQAGRPAASTLKNQVYYATDTGAATFSDGSAWHDIQYTQANGGVFTVPAGIQVHDLGNPAFLVTRDGGNGLLLLNNDTEIQSQIAANGGLRIIGVGAGVKISEGANGKQQAIGPMVAGSITVANTSITATSRIIPVRGPGGTNPGAWSVTAIVASTSYTIGSTNAADTGSGWVVINEAS